MDPYKILGVERSATDDEIKKKYRKLAMEHHPDKGGDPDKFKEISHAYEILSDKQKRQNFDRFGSTDSSRMGGSGFGGFDMNDIFSNFSDIFGGFGGFGGGFEQRTNKRQRKGQSVRIKVKLNLEEAFTGINKKIKIKRDVKCDKCNGTGSSDGVLSTCGVCGGSGQVVQTHRTSFGVMQNVSDCENCGGTGKVVKSKCKHCSGNGFVNKEEVIDLDIPMGVEDGMTLNSNNNGNYIKDGVPGDLIIMIIVENFTKFRVESGNLILDKEISIVDSILGSDIVVETIDKKQVKIKVEPGTKDGSTFRLKGVGMTKFNSHYRGDMYVIFKHKIPNNITEEERELLLKLKNSENFK